MPHDIAATFCLIGSAVQLAALHQAIDRQPHRHPGTRDRRRPGAAIRLDDVAIQRDLPLAQRRHVDDRPQRPSDQPLDFLRPPRLLALRRLARSAGMRRAGQHAVFRGHPTLALAAQERRHAFLDGRGHQDLGIAETDQHRSFGMAREARFDRDGAHLVGRTAAGAHGWSFVISVDDRLAFRIRARQPRSWRWPRPPSPN